LGIASCAFFFGTIVENHGYQAMFLTALAITLVGMVIFATGPRDLPSHRDPETPIA
jgi:predicted MFS family arabinose efflux permease